MKGLKFTLKGWRESRPRHSDSPPPRPSSPPSPPVLPLPDNESRALASLSTQCAMSLAIVAAELAPIPRIGILFGCLAVVFQAVEKSRVNRNQWKLLQGRCVMVTRIAGAQVSNYGGQHYEGLVQASGVLRNTITEIGARANYWNEMQEWLAFVQFQSMSDEIRSHFAALDHCLSFFSYATDIAQMQWVGEFSAVQRQELSDLQRIHTLLKGLNFNMDPTSQNEEDIKKTTAYISEQLGEVLDGETAISQNQSTMTATEYADDQKIINTIFQVTKMQLPPKLLLGRQCIVDAPVPIKSGINCDIYSASFVGGEKVAKKVFRIGASEKEHVERYAQRFLRDAQLWSEFKSEYTVPFYGVGMEAFDGDRHFQLYMVSPLMKNFDAVTYLKQHRTNPGMKEDIMRIITDAARGLQYLHDRQPPVVHSGLRGDNILITDSGGAVLGGFGLTKALRDSTGDEKVPPAVMTGKTESQRWMAPEMFAEDTPVLQTPSDVWSWAMASLELISGLIPYHQNRHSHIVLVQIRDKKLPQRSKHADFEKYALKPDEMWALMESCWQYEPEKRPTINDVIVELEKISGTASDPWNGSLIPTPVKTETKDSVVGHQSEQNEAPTLKDDSSESASGASLSKQPHITSSPSLETSDMTAQDIFDCLLAHGCQDLTPLIDPTQLSAMSYAGGAFGDIFKGKLQDGTEIGVKMLRSHTLTEDISPKWLKRLMREIYLWSKTDHPNVQELMGVAMLNNRLAMISLWMQKGNLQQYIRNFPDTDRYELCTQVAAGVAYLHSIDMVHGDLKALNILVSKDGIAKISDFDHSILSDCSLIFSATTNKNGGTFRWMAPELVLNEEDDDGPSITRNKQTDVYALGMTFLEIMTGNVPYAEYRSDGPIYGALMNKKFPKRPKPLSSSHKRGNLLWFLLEECWDHVPADRPEASEVHELLTKIGKLEDT